MAYRFVIVDECDEQIRANPLLRTIAAIGRFCAIVGLAAVGLVVIIAAVAVVAYAIAHGFGLA